jgi:hypothetical protein
MAECIQTGLNGRLQLRMNSARLLKGVFTGVKSTPRHVFLMDRNWTFVRKRIGNNAVVIYKARLSAQGFT